MNNNLENTPKLVKSRYYAHLNGNGNRPRPVALAPAPAPAVPAPAPEVEAPMPTFSDKVLNRVDWVWSAMYYVLTVGGRLRYPGDPPATMPDIIPLDSGEKARVWAFAVLFLFMVVVGMAFIVYVAAPLFVMFMMLVFGAAYVLANAAGNFIGDLFKRFFG